MVPEVGFLTIIPVKYVCNSSVSNERNSVLLMVSSNSLKSIPENDSLICSNWGKMSSVLMSLNGVNSSFPIPNDEQLKAWSEDRARDKYELERVGEYV